MKGERIRCLCPQCRVQYRVPSSAAGHRAKCRACGATFRVTEELSGPPTEDDILRWLLEAEEREERTVNEREAALRRSVGGSQSGSPRSAQDRAAPTVIRLRPETREPGRQADSEATNIRSA